MDHTDASALRRSGDETDPRTPDDVTRLRARLASEIASLRLLSDRAADDGDAGRDDLGRRRRRLQDERRLLAGDGSRLAEALTQTERRLARALASSSKDALREAYRRDIRAREEERRRLARDIHDGAQQQLLAIGVGLDLLSHDRTLPPRALERLGQLRAQLMEALEMLRDLARGIYPAALAEHGIEHGLRAATEHASPIVEVSASALGRYPAEIEGAVYFASLEAVQNATKHARATRIGVDVAERSNALVFSVSDDGAGFDDRQQKPGAGLRSISDRMHSAGGELKICSRPGYGTTVSGRIPLPVSHSGRSSSSATASTSTGTS
jgi:signal transduction histidine kinase